MVSPFHMPAMSPTMTEGGISAWKKKEGQSFAAGDVLLEIETDKATIEVEAQDDGVLGKILAPDGTKNLPIGKLIALLAEEGDDLSNIEIPEETAAPSAPQSEPAQSPSPSPSVRNGPTEHVYPDGPVFPSVLRLLNELHVSDFKKIKGTGVRGMITKGDVLAFLGKASTPTGTFKHVSTKVTDLAGPAAPAAPKEVKPLEGLALRQLIASGLSEIAAKKSALPKEPVPTFDSLLADYVPKPTPSSLPPATPSPPIKPGYFDGLF